MKRKLIYMFLISLTFGVVGLMNVNAETPTRSMCFRFDKATGTITNYKNYANYKKCPSDNVVIPSEIDGVAVEKIGSGAFMYNGLKNVVIPSSVKSIGNLAFASNLIENIVIPDTVTEIGYGAFNNNPSQNKTFIYERTDTNNDGIAEINTSKLISVAIDSNSFISDDVQSVTIPAGVTEIGTKAFYGLILEMLSIPEGVTTIDDEAFYGSLIDEVSVPTSLTQADFTVDKDQIPFLDVTYFKWLEYKNSEFLDYNYQSGVSASVVSMIYLHPELYYAEITSPSYNMVKLSWELDGSYDKVLIYKYNPTSKEYEYYTYSTNESGVTLSKGIVPGTTYYFKVKGYSKTPDGKEYYTELSKVLAVKPKLKAPTGVKVTKYKTGVAKVKWNKVAGADGYAVYKYNSKTKKYVLLKNTKSLYITNSGNKKGSKVYYKVRAYKMVNGKKVYSNYSVARSARV